LPQASHFPFTSILGVDKTKLVTSTIGLLFTCGFTALHAIKVEQKVEQWRQIEI
jgi:hypothetical protein